MNKTQLEHVLVIVPAYNEGECIFNTINSLLENTSYDILVIDDGSIDETYTILERFLESHPARIKVARLTINSGIGTAVQTGFIYAERYGYTHAVQFDGDGQHQISSLNKLITTCVQERYELCIGSRFMGGENLFYSTFSRRIGIKFFSKLIFSLTNCSISDPTSGFRAYGPLAIHHFSHFYPDDYPEPECILFCLRKGLPVGEVPVVMQERQGGESSIGTLASIYYMAKVTLGILFEWTRREK